MDETRQLARFVTQLRHEDLPEVVVTKTKALILDQYGVQMASARMPWSQAIYRHARALGGPAESTVAYYGDRLPALQAAFANGSFGHGFESDDSLRRAVIHPSCVVVSAATAMAERELASGKALLVATVIGFEVLARIALSTIPSLILRGHHPTATVGAFAAAAIGGKLLSFSEETLLHALSLAGAHACGLVVSTGGEQKRIYGGLAAHGGLRAALLAQAGITGSPSVLEGMRGFGHAFSDTFKPEEITKGLGTEYRLLEIIPKYYSADGHVHPMIDAAVRLLDRRPFGPDEVEKAVIGASRYIAERSIVQVPDPPDLTTAQFSGAFSVALRIAKRGNGFQEYIPENLSDPAVVGLARRIRVEVDPEVERDFPVKRGARLRVWLKDGTVLEELVDDIRSLSASEARAKFERVAGLVMPNKQLNALAACVDNLDNLPDLTPLARLLVAGVPGGD